MCVPYSCLRCRRLNQRIWSANHLVQSCSAWHHGENRVFLFHQEINQCCTSTLSCIANRWSNVLSTSRCEPKQSEGFGEFGEIWAQQRRCRITTIVEELLPLSHHA